MPLEKQNTGREGKNTQRKEKRGEEKERENERLDGEGGEVKRCSRLLEKIPVQDFWREHD